MNHSLYALLMGGSVLFPLLLSFDKKVAFYKQWKTLLPAIILSAVPFILKDIFFTRWEVWSFNSAYVFSPRLFNLPLEEWAFFVVVPYCCCFIHAVLNAYFPVKNPPKSISNWLIFKGLILVIVGFYFFSKIYTSTYFILGGLSLLGLAKFTSPHFQWQFSRTYLISLIPFFLVNGVLTYMPVVQYNANEIIGIRIGSIPLEDSIYCLLLLLWPILIWERSTLKSS